MKNLTTIFLYRCFLMLVFFNQTSAGNSVLGSSGMVGQLAPLDGIQREITTPDGLNAKRLNDSVYFYHENSIKVFDLNAGSWGNEFNLSISETSAFTVTATNFYAAHNNGIYKYPLNNNPPELIYTSADNVDDLLVINSDLVVITQENYTSIDAATNAVVDTQNIIRGTEGNTAIDSRNKIYSANINVIPRDINYMVVDDNGDIDSRRDGPYHGTYPISGKLYSFPNGGRIIDGSGIVYHSLDLDYAGTLNGAFDHIDFYYDLPIIIRGNTLHAYTNTLSESGTHTLSETKDLFFIHDDSIYLFKYGSIELDFETLDVSVLGPLSPNQVPDPVGLTYAPDSIVYNGSNEIYLLSRNNFTVFNFDANTLSYNGGIQLDDAPILMAYSVFHKRLYLGYSNNKITYIDPAVGVEVDFITASDALCGLGLVDNYVFVCVGFSTRNNFQTYNQGGILISDPGDQFYKSDEFHWSSQNRKLYHFRDNVSPNDLISTDIGISGIIGDPIDSPYHGGVTSYPICVNPNGSHVILGNGNVFDAISLEISNALTTDISHCAWSQGQFFSFDTMSGTNLSSWNENFVSTAEASWPGNPVDLIGLSSGALLVIHELDDVLQFALHKDMIFGAGFDN